MQETNPTNTTKPIEESEFGVHQIGVAPETDAEKKAVESYRAFKAVDVKWQADGTYFGQAMIELREEIKSSHGRNYRKRLDQLGISYEKARYWMAKIEGKETDRHKAKEDPISDWDSALQRLEALRDAVDMLMKSEPDGSDALVEPLRQLGVLLGCKIVSKGGENGVLQRERPDGGSVAEETDEGRANSAGCGR
jgi:hypothetical protein